MNRMTMIDIYNTARAASYAAHAAQRFSLSMAFTGALALAQDALEAEKAEYEATMALYSSFPTEEEEEAALQAEAEAASRAAWARVAAWSAWEAAQAAYAAEEDEEVRAYIAWADAHAAKIVNMTHTIV